MAFDVFISYSQKDAAAATAVCHGLEDHGIRCWIAPRDVPAGQGWKGSIVEAIRHARAVVLIFSAVVNDSKQVRREVDIAFEAGRTIVPFRIENVEMGDDLYYCLADRHWLDAINPPLEQHIDKLVQALKAILGESAEQAREPQAGEETPTVRATEPVTPPPQPPAVLTPPPVAESVPTVPEPQVLSTAAPEALIKPELARSGSRRSRMTTWIGVGVAAAVVTTLVALFGLKPSAAELTREGMAAVEAKHYAEALPLLQSAAKAGSAEAQGTLGRMYANGWGVNTDYGEARKWFELAAAQGHAIGYSGLGFLYLTGNGVVKDSVRGIELLHKGADANYPRALANLGFVYETGEGVHKDLNEAKRYYEKAANLNDSYSQIALGRLALAGGETPESDADAIKWYRKAADQGDADGACNLASVYATGGVAARSYPEALKWYRSAADQKAACGEAGLGYLYWFGNGVSANYDESVRWYELAASHGDTNARDFLAQSQNDWVLPPLFSAPWRALAGEERRKEIARLKQEDRLSAFGSADLRRMRSLDLSFYPNATLYELELARPGGSVGIFTYIRQNDAFVRLDGHSPQIHQLSRSAPIRIDTLQEAVAFLRFFMGAVQGKDGVFMVVDGVTDVPWLPSATSSQKQQAQRDIQRLAVEASPSGGWRAKATVRYRDALFIATIWIKPDGMVEMLDDNPIVEDLPVRIDRFDDDGLRVQIDKR